MAGCEATGEICDARYGPDENEDEDEEFRFKTAVSSAAAECGSRIVVVLVSGNVRACVGVCASVCWC